MSDVLPVFIQFDCLYQPQSAFMQMRLFRQNQQ